MKPLTDNSKLTIRNRICSINIVPRMNRILNDLFYSKIITEHSGLFPPKFIITHSKYFAFNTVCIAHHNFQSRNNSELIVMTFFLNMNFTYFIQISEVILSKMNWYLHLLLKKRFGNMTKNYTTYFCEYALYYCIGTYIFYVK